MGERLKTSLILLILILIVIIIGNYIHLYFTDKRLQNSHKDTCFKTGKDKLIILIEVHKKRLSLIDKKTKETIKEYVVATGKKESPSPLGSFKIIEKAQWGGGFGSRWMGLDVPWGKYGIHGTNQPGSIGMDISAGCIRMRNKDVEELYSLVDVGTTVHITNGLYGDFTQGFKKLNPGDRGTEVLEVQKRLQIQGYYTGSLDGIYGEDMKASLIQFLKDNRMEIDHEVNQEVYEKLNIIIMD